LYYPKSFDKNTGSIELKFDDFTKNPLYDQLNNIFDNIHYVMMVLIWIGLAQYNKNNIWKCIGSLAIAQYYGTIYLSKIY